MKESQCLIGPGRGIKSLYFPKDAVLGFMVEKAGHSFFVITKILGRRRILLQACRNDVQ